MKKPFNAAILMSRLKANVCTLNLLKELEIKNAELLEMSITDGLTKLYNHKHIYSCLE